MESRINGAYSVTHTKLDHATQTQAIREEMARVRSRLHTDVEATKTQINHAFDWRSYVESYPLTCVGVAAAVGYFLVPRGRPVVELTDKQTALLSKLARTASKGGGGASSTSTSPWSGLLAVAGAAVLRSALGAVTDRVLHPGGATSPGSASPASAAGPANESTNESFQ
ncbi:hypothetical protein Pla108_16070 [Botrimarina colliarenosi]|uniref:DUF3618 domain-containing protein n=1 Tax=Botrimarina colliarenosi TaxID=2528001 RepID=A0A5C6AKV1_9BACT|nr:hypothetical protein [Botrimarina colliarenosi]TWU00655.1 hypothetical protein Pla108_16070 [Botrimarina colliarenosi]